jgi:hypothetical protein
MSGRSPEVATGVLAILLLIQAAIFVADMIGGSRVGLSGRCSP